MEKGVLLEIDGLYGFYKIGLITDTIMKQLKKANKKLFDYFDENVSDWDKLLTLKDTNFDENGDFEIKLSELNDVSEESGLIKIDYYKTKEVFYTIEKKKTLIESQLNKSKSFKDFDFYYLKDYNKYLNEENIYEKRMLVASHSIYKNVKKRYLIKSLDNMKKFKPDRVFNFKENLFVEKFGFSNENNDLIMSYNGTKCIDFFYIHDMEMIDFLKHIIQKIEPKKTIEKLYHTVPTRCNYSAEIICPYDETNICCMELLFERLVYSKLIIEKDKRISINEKFLKKLKSYFEPYKLELIEDFDFSESMLIEQKVSIRDKSRYFKLLKDNYVYQNKHLKNKK